MGNQNKGVAPEPSRLVLSIKAMVANSLKMKKNKNARLKVIGWTRPPWGLSN